MEKMRAMVLSQCAPIETNPLKLEKIDKHQIKKVVSVMNKDDTMVLVKKGSLGDFVPSKDTYISNNHKILIDGDYYAQIKIYVLS